LPKLTSKLDLSIETAEWQNGWYVNSNYGDGLTNYNSVIGHWGGNYKTTERDLGAKAYSGKLIWDIANGHSLTFKYKQLKNTTIEESDFETAKIGTIEYARATGQLISGLTLTSGQDVRGESFSRISAFIRW
jgi:hypothetical protein